MSVTLSVESLLQIVALILQQLAIIWPFPNWYSSEEVRAWLRRVSMGLKNVISVTTIKIDDAILAAVDAILNDDIAWNMLYQLVMELVHKDVEIEHTDHVLLSVKTTDAPVMELAERIATDPVVILLIIQVVVLVIRIVMMFTNRGGYPNQSAVGAQPKWFLAR